jgi:hypothetical protein
MFDPNIPVFNRETLTNEMLVELKAKYSQYDEKYVANACIEERRRVLDEAYNICKDYLDDGFVNEICKYGKFMDRLWELSLCSILIHKNYTLEKWTKTNKPKPDFCILLNGKKIWVEAVCPDVGDIDPVSPPPVLIPGVIHGETVDISTDIRPRALRASSAFIKKVAKREEYIKGGLMAQDEPYIIAINTHRITRHSDTMIEELMLYGMGLHQVNLKTGVGSRQWRPETIKIAEEKEVPIPMAYFLRPEYKIISAVIFHGKWFEFEPQWKDLLADSTTIYFNEGAHIPIEKDVFPFGKRKYIELTGTQAILKEV